MAEKKLRVEFERQRILPRPRRSWHLIVVGVLLCLGAGSDPIQAQGVIASDRPGIGSGSFVLGPGTLQMEAGGELAQAGEVDQISLGQLLFRVGAFDGLELQAQVNSLVLSRGGETDEEGLEDLGLGAKLRMISDGPAGVNLSFLTTLSLPTGAGFLSSDEAVPAVSFLADLPLASALGLSANLGFGGFLADAEDEISLILTPAFALPTSANLGVFAGYAGFFADSGDRHFFEGGLTWIPGPDLQLDINGGVDVNTGDGFLGVGVATRWSF